jgi:hypothetical protein
MSSTNARNVAAGERAVAKTSAPLAPVIPLRPAFDPWASWVHVHDWKVIGEESDGFGRVREIACLGCPAVRYT